MQNYVVYKRLSREDVTGAYLGLDAQQTAINEFLARTPDCNVVDSFEEIVTGTNKKVRPLFLAAIERCKLTNSILLIAKLDRMSRNVATIANLMESKVNFVALDMQNANPFTIHVLAAVAEHEVNMISTRIKAALKATKERGTVLGRVGRFNLKDADKEKGRVEAIKKIKSNADVFAKQIEPILRECQAKFMTLSEIATHLSSLNIKTVRGKSYWYPSQVLSCIKRLK